MPKLPKLRLTHHAQMRMVERAIDIDHAKQAIAEPDKRKGDTYGKIRVTKKIEGKTIVVVYSDEKFKDRKNEYLIMSFYYLSE